MPCHPFVTPEGVGFVCSRGPRRGPRRFCVVCLRAGRKTPAPLLCDFREAPGGPTCDKALCRECAVSISPNVDHCPEHGR